VYVVEQNRDGQMLQLMRLDLPPERQSRLRSVLHYDGLPIDARSITDAVLAQEGLHVATHAAPGAGASSGAAGGE
jgi:2-oxoglutarate ferredoxin oxidoreductase subunit alpha